MKSEKNLKKWQEAGESPVDEGVSWFVRLRSIFKSDPVQQEGGKLSNMLVENDEIVELRRTLLSLNNSLVARQNLKSDTDYIETLIKDIETKINEIEKSKRWF